MLSERRIAGVERRLELALEQLRDLQVYAIGVRQGVGHVWGYGDGPGPPGPGSGLSDLFIAYTWAQSQKDLDSNTKFLGETVGYGYNGAHPYLNWSGDDTGTGGTEWVRVLLNKSWLDGQWSDHVQVTGGADWYTPSHGSGPAVMTIATEDVTTGAVHVLFTLDINPGQEITGSTSTAATIDITFVDGVMGVTLE